MEGMGVGCYPLAESFEDREMRIGSLSDATAKERLGEGGAVVRDGRRGLVAGGRRWRGRGRDEVGSCPDAEEDEGRGMLSKVLGCLPDRRARSWPSMPPATHGHSCLPLQAWVRRMGADSA